MLRAFSPLARGRDTRQCTSIGKSASFRFHCKCSTGEQLFVRDSSWSQSDVAVLRKMFIISKTRERTNEADGWYELMKHSKAFKLNYHHISIPWTWALTWYITKLHWIEIFSLFFSKTNVPRSSAYLFSLFHFSTNVSNGVACRQYVGPLTSISCTN